MRSGAGCAALAALLAQPAAAGLVAERDFARADADRSGLIDWHEFALAHPDAGRALFMAVDRDGNGSIDRTEYMAAHDAGLLEGR